MQTTVLYTHGRTKQEPAAVLCAAMAPESHWLQKCSCLHLNTKKKKQNCKYVFSCASQQRPNNQVYTGERFDVEQFHYIRLRIGVGLQIRTHELK